MKLKKIGICIVLPMGCCLVCGDKTNTQNQQKKLLEREIVDNNIILNWVVTK